MRLLGIDFGTKRVGLALSDEGGVLAFPKTTLLNNENLIQEIQSVVNDYNVAKIVVGESKNLDGKDNPLMEHIKDFCEELKEEIKIDIFLEPEFLTSFQAKRFQGETGQTDASAAAIILQSYIDKDKNKK